MNVCKISSKVSINFEYTLIYKVAELVKKSQQLEVDLDKTTEQLLTTTQQLEEKEKALLAAELEVNALNR